MIALTEVEIRGKVEELGYILLDWWRENKRIYVKITDDYGYLYQVQYHDLMSNKNAWAVAPNNPFVLHNISTWLKLNDKDYVLADGNKYIGKENRNLRFYCPNCDDVFTNCWNDIRNGGQDCGICSGRQTGEKHSLAQLRPDLMDEWSDENTLNPFELTLGSHEHVYWICKNGHRWETGIQQRTRLGRGCPYCVGQRPTPENNFAVHYPELLNEWDYESNGDPKDYLSVTRDNVWWICSQCDHHWQTEIQYRTNGKSNCPRCSISNGEDRIYEILNNWGWREGIDFIKEKKFPDCRDKGLLRFDFYFPNHNLCVEYYGIQHYEDIGFFDAGGGFEGLKHRDSIKQQYCYDNNINLLIIPHWDFDNIETILYDTLTQLQQEGGQP
jgi:hypothetical protein